LNTQNNGVFDWVGAKSVGERLKGLMKGFGTPGLSFKRVQIQTLRLLGEARTKVDVLFKKTWNPR
jgi:hypothetical protein